MTHYSRFALPHDPHQIIQCHNIGLLWLTSTSISGKVIVYESLYQAVNESLKRKLVCICKGLCNDNGSLDITVILQLRQRGTSNCGLFFCIANAVALANAIDSSMVSWSQDGMCDHLRDVLSNKKLNVSPRSKENIQSPVVEL